MADETPEQIKNHRDQLKEENDRLNPELDKARLQVTTPTESLRDAQRKNGELAATNQSAKASQKQSEEVATTLHAQSSELTKANGQLQARNDALVADLQSLTAAATAATKPMIDILESLRVKSL